MSRYSEYVEKHVPKPPIVPTDWDYVSYEFDDIIDGSILDGNKEGPSRYPKSGKRSVSNIAEAPCTPLSTYRIVGAKPLK